MYQVTPDEARDRLSDLIAAALRGEIVLIERDEEHIVQLVPVSHARRSRTAGSARGAVVMSDDFDSPLPDFEDYTS